MSVFETLHHKFSPKKEWICGTPRPPLIRASLPVLEVLGPKDSAGPSCKWKTRTFCKLNHPNVVPIGAFKKYHLSLSSPNHLLFLPFSGNLAHFILGWPADFQFKGLKKYLIGKLGYASVHAASGTQQQQKWHGAEVFIFIQDVRPVINYAWANTTTVWGISFQTTSKYFETAVSVWLDFCVLRYRNTLQVQEKEVFNVRVQNLTGYPYLGVYHPTILIWTFKSLTGFLFVFRVEKIRCRSKRGKCSQW